MNKWLKIFIVIFLFAFISTAIYFLLKFYNITNIETLKSIIISSGKWSYIVYTLLLILILVVFCFIPLLNTTMIILGIALFGSKIAFITNIISIFFSTSILFFIGDKIGEKFVIKLIGKKNLEETQNLIDHKSKFWLPILFLIPGIPDEAICIVAGMTKIKYLYLIIVSLIYHAIEIGVFCFLGSNLISWASFTFTDWIIVINLILIDIYLLIKFEKFLEKQLKNSKK